MAHARATSSRWTSMEWGARVNPNLAILALYNPICGPVWSGVRASQPDDPHPIPSSPCVALSVSLRSYYRDERPEPGERLEEILAEERAKKRQRAEKARGIGDTGQPKFDIGI